MFLLVSNEPFISFRRGAWCAEGRTGCEVFSIPYHKSFVSSARQLVDLKQGLTNPLEPSALRAFVLSGVLLRDCTRVGRLRLSQEFTYPLTLWNHLPPQFSSLRFIPFWPPSPSFASDRVDSIPGLEWARSRLCYSVRCRWWPFPCVVKLRAQLSPRWITGGHTTISF